MHRSARVRGFEVSPVAAGITIDDSNRRTSDRIVPWKSKFSDRHTTTIEATTEINREGIEPTV
jgi:hypothetical protein